MKKVTLAKMPYRRASLNQKATAASLGLHRVGDSIIHEEGAVLDGKVRILSHLVKVEDV